MENITARAVVTPPFGTYHLLLGSLTVWISTPLSLYLLAVRALRYRRVRALEKEYAKLGKLTPAAAQRIVLVPLTLDLPFMSTRAQEFALFKTYGIHTISRLLNQTKQLVKKETGSKRYMDTALLVGSWITFPITGPGSGAVATKELDPRGAIAVARTRWIHAQYPSISNDDFLYTLSVFIYEPIRWAERYEWRSFSPVECEALYIFWTEIGRRMGIRDIPPSFNEFQEWSEAYERGYMVPEEVNNLVAQQTITLVLHKVPDILGLKSFGRRVVICLLEERLRKAMLLPAQPPLLKQAVHSVLRARGFFIRNFCLPRIKPVLIVNPDPKLKSGSELPRAYPQFYDNDPWYYPESTGLRKLWERAQVALGLARVEDFPGEHFQNRGYRLEELGPKGFTRSAHDKVMEMAEQMQGAPVTGPWSLNYKGGCPMTRSF